MNKVTTNLYGNDGSVVDSSAHDQGRPGAYLDVGAVDNWNVRSCLLDERDETWHLRIIDEDDIRATRGLRKHIGNSKTRDKKRRSLREGHLQRASSAQRCR